MLFWTAPDHVRAAGMLFPMNRRKLCLKREGPGSRTHKVGGGEEKCHQEEKHGPPPLLKTNCPPHTILFSVMLFSSCPSSSFPSSRGGRRGQKRWGIRARAAKNCMDTRGGRGRQREGGRSASVVVTRRSQCVRDGPVTKPVRQRMRRGVARTSRRVFRTVCMWHG